MTYSLLPSASADRAGKDDRAAPRADLNPRPLGYEDSWGSAFSLSGDAFCTGEMRRQELSGSVQPRGGFVMDRVIGLEDVGQSRGDAERDLDVGGGGWKNGKSNTRSVSSTS